MIFEFSKNKQELLRTCDELQRTTLTLRWTHCQKWLHLRPNMLLWRISRSYHLLLMIYQMFYGHLTSYSWVRNNWKIWRLSDFRPEMSKCLGCLTQKFFEGRQISLFIDFFHELSHSESKNEKKNRLGWLTLGEIEGLQISLLTW